MTKPRIAILGGGTAAVTAAYFLSGSPEVRERYDIELYQQGWRLGGKGASGRGAGDDRIEEHGLHIWFGYYENAFRMLRDCHAELNTLAEQGQARWSTTMHGIETAFRPISSIGIVEDEAPGWRPWIATFPEDDASPWDRDLISEPPDWDLGWYLETLLTRSAALVATVLRSAADEGHLIESSIEPGGNEFEEILVGAGQRLADADGLTAGPSRAIAAIVARWVQMTDRGEDGELHDIVVQALTVGGRLLDAVRLRLDERLVTDRAAVRRLWALADVMLAIVRGLLHERVAAEEDFERLDEVEFRTWLQLHGALAESTRSSLVRTLAYDLPFAYEEGDADLGSCGAGTAMRTLFRAFFTYRGAIMWKLNSGMGDVVFAPLYELLHKRGVKFKFFHQITEIITEENRVAGFRFRHQDGDPSRKPEDRLLAVEVTAGGRMPPGWLQCWPAQPKGWTAEAAESLESYWGAAPGKEEYEKLDPGDLVVFGLPLGTVEHVAKRLVDERPAWRDLVDHVRTTATQAMQIWVDRSAEKLGWYEDAVVGGYTAPYDTFSDMPELRFHERVDAATVLYLCAVLPDAPDGSAPAPGQDPAAWVQRRWGSVLANAEDFLRTQVVGLWPGAADPATGLFDQRIEKARYVRGNVQPSDRYVLSVPGSVRYRLEPGDTGYDNLMIAGDWTRCVINAGCVEAATISGMLAAEAIMGRLPVPIIGRSHVKEGDGHVPTPG
ncbi:NAD(P)-binding protein [Actinoplanes sp. CA-142083]|uniref:NAD(P)-binding protein n=1 Tax=Actinoplanes sp. CA-142083 TaxID=3239903 RepID=UPI003D8C2C7F